MNKELTVQEAALAWAQGKKVQAENLNKKGPWLDIVPVGSNIGDHWATVFSSIGERYRFRLAPEPPAKRYRPWALEELPAMAIFRKTHTFGWFALQGANEGGVWFNTPSWGTGQARFDQLLNDHEHSTDNGKTWLPCGVEVES